MRIVVFGTGAVGGTVAAALTGAGHKVVAIARGAQLEAIQAGGLRLRSPQDDVTVRFDTVAHPGQISFKPDDAILLAMKGQHTQVALEALRAAGVTNQPIFCLQNGVDNERKALRLFPNVHGITVLMPARFTTPGEVVVYSEPKYGVFYVGCAVGGQDKDDVALAEALRAANIAAVVTDDVMATKYGKLLMNLNNIIGAAFRADADTEALKTAARKEAEAVLAAAEIGWADMDINLPPRKKHMRVGEVPGVPGFGSSTAQSLQRGTGSIETDWLNGEIALLGRLHGVATPVNSALTELAARLAREGAKPGSVSPGEVMTLMGR